MKQRKGPLTEAGDGKRIRRWSWAHFAYGFLPAAALSFFSERMPFFGSFWPHVAETIVAGILAGTLTGTCGERGFEELLRGFGRSRL